MVRVRWFGWALLWVPCIWACGGRSQYRGAGDDDGGSTTDMDSGASASVVNCAQKKLGSALGKVAEARNAGAPTGGGTGCGTTTGYNEVTFEWRAPATARYRIDTQVDGVGGIGLDTVLGLRAAGCPGEELACNDDYQDRSSGIVYDFQEGEVVTIVLNSVGPEGGQYQLNIHELDHAACPYTWAKEGIIPSLGREFESDCGGVGPAATIQLARQVGVEVEVEVEVEGMNFEPVIQVRNSCDGPAIACVASSNGRTARVHVEAETAVLIIQGRAQAAAQNKNFRVDYSQYSP